MKVSLVATVKDAAAHLAEFLESVRAQTLAPDEIVIVDGGSTDGTIEILRANEDIALLEAPGANISRGRNLAIEVATHEVIAVTDVDCVLEPGWLERLLGAVEQGADVAMGFFRPITGSLFEACVAGATLPEAHQVDPSRFMPSSRSVAFRRDVFQQAGGYPEWLDIGEDMFLSHRLRELPVEMTFVPEAVVRWRLRPGPRETWAQYFRYARGDALAGMYLPRHLIRFGTYGLLAWALATRRRGVLGALGLAAAWHAGRRLPRTWRLLPGAAARGMSVAIVPAVIALIDAAKMTGYLAGLLRRAGR